jgi:predicted nucleic acid-binding protein
MVRVLMESTATLIALTVQDYVAAIKNVSQLGLAGGVIYDALVVQAAQKAKVDKLLTFNTDHFLRVWPEGKRIICTP